MALHPQNGGLHLIKPEIAADKMMVIARFHSMLTADTETPANASSRHITIPASRRQGSSTDKAEKAASPWRPPSRSHYRTGIPPDGLGRVFYDLEFKAFRDLVNGVHLAAGRKMHRNDGARFCPAAHARIRLPRRHDSVR
jgi:hypothetical protein